MTNHTQSLYHKLTKFFISFYIAYGLLSSLFVATNLKTALAPSSVKHFLLSFGKAFKVFLVEKSPLPPARHQSHLLIPSAQTISQKKAKNSGMRFYSKQIVSYCLGLHKQNPGLREVDLEPNPKRGSGKINMLKEGRKTAEENKLYRTGWTHIWITASKRGASRTEALVSLY